MIVSRTALSLIGLLILSHAWAQTTSFKVDLPTLLPASPEPTAFVKAGVGNSNLSTGAATASIPLYTIKIKNFTFPISLSYSTQGLKADEACSRVGHGMLLTATGMVTRSVKGEPDEFAQRLAPPSSDLTTDTTPLFNFYNQVSTSGSGYDSQADEFQFNFNGYSGKFVLDNTYHARVTSTGNLKVDVQISVTPGSTAGNISLITFTAPDGVKYTFGTNYEITTDTNSLKYSVYKLVTKTAFFLDRIDLPTGEYLLFNYTPITITVPTGIDQTLKLASGAGAETCGTCTSSTFGHGSYTTTLNRVVYNSKYLSSIVVSNGITVNLSYATVNTQMNDKRVTGLEVVGQKKFTFQYYDVAFTSSSSAPRFFLTTLSDITDPTVPLNYTFTYDRLSQVPLPISYQQDYLGFYNGNGRTYLIPPSKNSSNVMDLGFRDPKPDQAKLGTLTQIQYPTGGKEEYFYEANTVLKIVPSNTSNATYNLDGAGGGSSGSSSPVVYTNNSITIPYSQTVTLSAYAEDALPSDGYTADPTHHTVSVWIYQGNGLVASRSVLGYQTSSTTVNLAAGTYQFKMQVDSYTEVGHASISYSLVSQPVYDTLNAVVPGVRLQKIVYTDPFTSSTHSKYFKYASLSKLNYSSGGGLFPVYVSDNLIRSYCGDFSAFTTTCLTEIYASNSTNLVYTLSGAGSPIYYPTVIESDDPNFANGGTEYTFYPNDDGSKNLLIIGRSIPYLSGGHYPTLTGVVKIKKMFDQNKAVVQTEQDDYETFADISGMPVSIYVRKNFEPSSNDPGRLDAFDVVSITYENNWTRLKTKTITSYASGTAFTQVTNYTYGTTVNVLPATVTTTDSKGLELKTENKYPTITVEEPGADPALVSSVNSLLVSKNIISPVIQESSYRNSTLQQQKRILYKDWFSNGVVLAPEKIQLKESASDVLHDELIYTQYDTQGNPLNLQKSNDISMVYLWDNILQVPIAEARNTAPSQVAYTSFENNALGNWSITSGATTTTSPFTGTLSFTGTIQKAISTTGTYTYVVTLWTSSAIVPTMNGTAGTKLRSANGCDLYQWKLPITNSGTITVTGTQIDEVRLFPEGAEMQTLTYKPFIGPTSKVDVNNRVTYYTYDNSNRLQLLKDQDGNVIKTFEYHYKN